MKQRILSITMALIALIALLALSGCGEEEPEPEDTATPVEVALVERGGISAENRVSGQVASGDQQSVFVAVSAQCTDVYVEVGDTVSAGQTICTLDISSTLANYDTAVMSYESARKSYADQSALLSKQVAQAEKTVEEVQDLFEKGVVPELVVDSAKASLDNARASMNSALSQLEVSMKNYEATIAQLETSLANVDRSGRVVAPISGTVVSLNASKNNFVAPSAPVATIESTSNMEVSTAVSESLVSKLTKGGRADVTISSANQSFQGTISSIGWSPSPQTHLYSVTIQIPSSMTSGLFSGMFADVTFYTDTQNNVVVIPTEAIQTGVDGQYVYILDSEDLAHKVMVETGLVGDGVTEITTGLSGGERLVTVGQFYLSEGDPVRVVSGEV